MDSHFLAVTKSLMLQAAVPCCGASSVSAQVSVVCFFCVMLLMQCPVVTFRVLVSVVVDVSLRLASLLLLAALLQRSAVLLAL